MERNGKKPYRVVKRLTDEERDQILKEFARLQKLERSSKTDNDSMSNPV